MRLEKKYLRAEAKELTAEQKIKLAKSNVTNAIGLSLVALYASMLFYDFFIQKNSNAVNETKTIVLLVIGYYFGSVKYGN